jgi:hypothetical protein
MKILQTIEEYNKKKQEIVTDFKENFFQELFDKYENLHFIPILSYTPYFNDGEPCTRSTYFFLSSDLDEGLEHINDWFEDETLDKSSLFHNPTQYEVFFTNDWKFKRDNAKLYTINNKLTEEEIKEIENILESVAEFIEEILDDHTVNLVKRENDKVVILSNEYEHD